MKDFTLIGTFNTSEGYGHATIATINALYRLGAQFEIAPIQHDDAQWPPERTMQVDGLAVMWTVPEYWDRILGADELWGIFVWETTLLPWYRANMINERATRLFTFSEWGRQMFIDSGVTIPIHVMPHGVDQREYHFVERNHEGWPYTFLILGELGNRKGWVEAYQVFDEEFRGNPDVRLIMKTRGRCLLAECVDPNVEVLYADFGVPMMRELYGFVDCFLFPSKGEGYGLPPREAAATGLPCIVTGWSGLLEGGIENYAYPLGYTMVKAQYGYQSFETCGDWAQPDKEQLKELMRFCYENRQEARRKGREAARWIKGNCTWEQGAQVLLDTVEEFA